MSFTTIQTFKIQNNPLKIERATAQCVAALADLGCSSTITTYKTFIRVTSDQKLNNLQTGENSRISFKLLLQK